MPQDVGLCTVCRNGISNCWWDWVVLMLIVSPLVGVNSSLH